jgi:hypothetical protein
LAEQHLPIRLARFRFSVTPVMASNVAFRPSHSTNEVEALRAGDHTMPEKGAE